MGSIVLVVRIHSELVAHTYSSKLCSTTSDDCLPLTIRVKHESRWSADPCVGCAEIELSDLLEKCRLEPGGDGTVLLVLTFA